MRIRNWRTFTKAAENEPAFQEVEQTGKVDRVYQKVRRLQGLGPTANEFYAG